VSRSPSLTLIFYHLTADIMVMSYENELPDGWVRQYDDQQKHPYWVDTKSKPPRAIWVHPYEDEQFLDAHPEIRERLAKTRETTPPPSTDELPPPYTPRRHSYSGPSKSGSDMDPKSKSGKGSTSNAVAGSSSGAGSSRAGSSKEAQMAEAKRRGFFGKIKDKAIGTKEEREEARRQEAIIQRRRAEQRRRAYEEMRRQEEEYRRQQAENARLYYQQQPQYGRSYYAPPTGDPYGYNNYGGYESYGRYQHPQQSSGFGGVGLPLLGGLAGGLILGDLLGGGMF